MKSRCHTDMERLFDLVIFVQYDRYKIVGLWLTMVVELQVSERLVSGQ